MVSSLRKWIVVGSMLLGSSGCDAFEYYGPLPNLRKAIPINFSELRQLKSLDIRNSRLTSEAARELRLINTIESFNMEDCKLTDSHALARSLADMSRLKHIVIRRTNINDADLAELASMTSLKTLELVSTDVRGDVLRELAKLPIQSLILHSKLATAESLTCLADFENLEELYLDAPNVFVDELPSLARLKKLQALSLYACNFSEMTSSADNSRFLSELPALKSLVISSDSVSNATFEAIAKIQSLESLEMVHTIMSDAQVVALEPLQNLTSLKVHMAEKISAATIPSLLQHRKLEVVCLTNARISWKDAEQLDILPNMTVRDVGWSEQLNVLHWSENGFHGRRWEGRESRYSHAGY